MAGMDAGFRIGYGEDAHRLAAGRPLVVGGVRIEGAERGAEAHSDGDVLLHALADALLAAFALGDIGKLFPPGEARTRDLDSTVILREVLGRLRSRAAGWRVVNVAAVVTLDAPRLGRHRERIEQRVAGLLGLPPGAVGVGFKTSEGLAPDHVQARVTLLMAQSGA